MAAARLESGLSDRAASPLTMAASRVPRAGERARGVQRALWGSPSAAVLARPAAAAEAPEAERAPISRSPVKDTWTPARVVRQGASTATSTARTFRSGGTATESATARAVRRAAVPARPRPVAQQGVTEAPEAVRPRASTARQPSRRPSLLDVQAPGVRTRPTTGAGPDARRGESGRGASPVSAGVPAPGRVPATARALDRGRSMVSSRLMSSPTGLASQPAAAAGSPLRRAEVRAESASPTPGSVVPRPLPAVQRRLDAPVKEEGWLDAGFARTAPPASRRLSVARSSQGMFAPSAVVVAPAVAQTADVAESAVPGPRPARTTSTGAKVVSGWSRNDLPASTTRVVRGGRPVDAASPTRNAERRIQAAAASDVQRASQVVQAGRVDRGDAKADRSSAAADRPLAAANARSARPANESGALNPTAVPRLARRNRARKAVPVGTGVALQPALAAGVGPQTEQAERSSVRAARRTVTTPVVGRTAGRSLDAGSRPAESRSRFGRANPVAHAAPNVTRTVRLAAETVRRLGVVRNGRAEEASSWLVSGTTANRAVAAARRARPSADAPGSLGAQLAAEAASAAARGTVRRSQLWAPDQVTAQATTLAESGEPGSEGIRRVGGFDARGSADARTDVPDARPAGRPLDWLDDRTFASLTPPRRRAALAAQRTLASRSASVPQSCPGTSARRGRHLVRTPEGRYGRAAAARRAGNVATGFVVPTPDAAPSVAPEGRDPVTGAPVVNGWARPQAALSDTLASVEDRQSDAHLPVWARRASGTPLVGGANSDLVTALARASAPEEVVRVIMEKGDLGGTVASTLPAPALQVIEKIKTVAREEVSEAIRAEVQARTVTARQAGRRAEAPRSTARVVQGFTGLRRGNSARSGSGVGDDKVMKLAKKPSPSSISRKVAGTAMRPGVRSGWQKTAQPPGARGSPPPRLRMVGRRPRWTSTP